MVDAHEEIAELDLNPVIAGADGALVVDARIRVESRPPRVVADGLRRDRSSARQSRAWFLIVRTGHGMGSSGLGRIELDLDR